RSQILIKHQAFPARFNFPQWLDLMQRLLTTSHQHLMPCFLNASSCSLSSRIAFAGLLTIK
ncbi:TPA: hypothetical protein ACG7PB_004292, partial [Escherichia coli]